MTILDNLLVEARTEFKWWDERVKDAKQWGAALAAANAFRNNAQQRIDRLLAKGAKDASDTKNN